MDNPLTVLVLAAVALSLIVAVISMLSGPSPYDQIGGGRLAKERARGPGSTGGSGGSGEPTPGSAAGLAEREQEIRQMLQARSERLVRNGHPALDVDVELTRLTQPQPGAPEEEGLVEEARQLVVARNQRRVRQGMRALDVEAEVQRTLRELSPDA